MSKTKSGFAWISVVFSRVEVWTTDTNDCHMIGHGLAYWDGENLLRPDLTDMDDNILASGWFTIRWLDEPQLAVYANNVH